MLAHRSLRSVLTTVLLKKTRVLAAGRKRGRQWWRKESADTQDYESCQWNCMDVDTDGDMEESSFIAVR